MDDAPKSDPRRDAEDYAQELYDRMTPFTLATIFWLALQHGMSRDKALDIRRRGVGAT